MLQILLLLGCKSNVSVLCDDLFELDGVFWHDCTFQSPHERTNFVQFFVQGIPVKLPTVLLPTFSLLLLYPLGWALVLSLFCWVGDLIKSHFEAFVFLAKGQKDYAWYDGEDEEESSVNRHVLSAWLGQGIHYRVKQGLLCSYLLVRGLSNDLTSC